MAAARLGGRTRLSLLTILRKSERNNNHKRITILSEYFYSTSAKPAAAAPEDSNYDIVVVGGGIVGIATARELKIRQPTLKMCIVEKEAHLAAHQSGHNSGVIHSGVYYKPGSLKAELCVQGQNLAYEYLDKYGLPYSKCGKLIVATNQVECQQLEELHKRGIANKVRDLKMIDATGIKEIEPHCQGLRALWCPHTGIVDWQAVALSMAEDFKKRGGQIFNNYKVTSFRESKDLPGGFQDQYPVTVVSDSQSVRARFVLTCGGLQSDQLSVMSGCKQEPRIIPFRGEYLILNPEKRHLVRGNIYPVPDPRYPFLGVHFTPRMDGSLWLGPNAVLALKREGYSWAEYDLKELFEVLKFSGFRKLAWKNAVYGSGEMLKSAFLFVQLRQLQKYIPEITLKDISRGPSGVRAQAMNNEGQLVDDFVFDKGVGPLGKRVLHCRNAPSPAATSSMAIAHVIADKVKGDMDGNE